MAKLQLIGILRELAGSPPNYSNLSNVIRMVDNRGPDFRTLKNIIEGKTAPCLPHLEAIDAFLRSRGRPGLDTVRILEPEGLLRSLVENGHITFYLPPLVQEPLIARADYRDYISWWDLRAFSSVVESINNLGSYIHVDAQSEPPQPRATDLATVDWEKLLDVDNRTYCAVGSPLVSGLSGYMLGKMFNIEHPFAPPPRGVPRLPFYFVWYPRDDSGSRGPYPNAFALCTDDLRQAGLSASGDLLQAIDNKQAQAFVFGDKVLEVRLEREKYYQYGVVVAQRRRTGAIWAVVAGLSGPGTFACADILPEIMLAVPDCADGKDSPVIYAVVQSTIGRDGGKEYGDARKVLRRDFVRPTPERWPP